MGIIDFAGHPDQLVVPLLAWLRQHQPELMTNPTSGKRHQGSSLNCSQ
ncbi:phage tail protein [Aeromonas molluscorum]